MIFNLCPLLQEKLDGLLNQSKNDGIDRLCTGVIIYKDQHVLLVRRVPEDTLGGYYELAGGGVDPDEDILSGLFRECREELGLEILKINDVFHGFDFIGSNGDRVRQINFFVEVEDKKVSLNPLEHDDILWVSRENFSNHNISDEMKASIETFFRFY